MYLFNSTFFVILIAWNFGFVSAANASVADFYQYLVNNEKSLRRQLSPENSTSFESVLDTFLTLRNSNKGSTTSIDVAADIYSDCILIHRTDQGVEVDKSFRQVLEEKLHNEKHLMNVSNNLQLPLIFEVSFLKRRDDQMSVYAKPLKPIAIINRHFLNLTIWVMEQMQINGTTIEEIVLYHEQVMNMYEQESAGQNFELDDNIEENVAQFWTQLKQIIDRHFKPMNKQIIDFELMIDEQHFHNMFVMSKKFNVSTFLAYTLYRYGYDLVNNANESINSYCLRLIKRWFPYELIQMKRDNQSIDNSYKSWREILKNTVSSLEIEIAKDKMIDWQRKAEIATRMNSWGIARHVIGIEADELSCFRELHR